MGGRSIRLLGAALALIAASITTIPPAQAAPTVQDIAAQLDPDRNDLGALANTYAAGPTVADFTRDGIPDVLLGWHNKSPWKLMRGNADGSFTFMFELPRADRHGCVVADWVSPNGGPDGIDDMFCTRGADSGTSNSKTNELFVGNGDPKTVFVRGADGNPLNIAAARGVNDPTGRGTVALALDFNGGAPDLFLGNRPPVQYPSNDTIFVNNGGYFKVLQAASLPGPYGALCADTGDINGDGLEDFLTCGRGHPRLYRNANRQTYNAVHTSEGLPAVGWGGDGGWWGPGWQDALLVDLNGDRLDDIVAVSLTKFEVRLNRGATPRFSTIDYSMPLKAGHGVCVGDADGDGKPDVLVVDGVHHPQYDNVAQGPDTLLLNAGNGKSFTKLAVPRPKVTAAPRDGDGDRCVAIENYAGTGRAAFIVDQGHDAMGYRQFLVLRDGTTTPPPPPPTAAIRINAGGPARSGFEADRSFTGGRVSTTTSPIAGTTDDALYADARVADADNTGFSYSIPVTSGTYQVTLSFVEPWFTGEPGKGPVGAGRRIFDVRAEGVTKISRLDINAAAGPLTLLRRTFTVAVTDGKLDLQFPRAAANRPIVAAIEVTKA